MKKTGWTARIIVVEFLGFSQPTLRNRDVQDVPKLEILSKYVKLQFYQTAVYTMCLWL